MLVIFDPSLDREGIAFSPYRATINISEMLSPPFMYLRSIFFIPVVYLMISPLAGGHILQQSKYGNTGTLPWSQCVSSLRSAWLNRVLG